MRELPRMPKRGFLTIVLILATTLPARGAVPAHLDGPALVQASRTGLPVVAEIGALGRLPLRLWPNVIHALGARFTQTDARGTRHHVRPEPFWTLAGEVVGAQGSVVRLTVTEDWVSGFVAVNGREVWIEPDDHEHAARTVITEPALMSSGGAPAGDVALIPPAAPASHGGSDVNLFGLGNCVLVTCGELEALIVLDGDKFYRDLSPSTCFARQAATLNNVDAIYRLAATRINLTVTAQNCRTEADLGGTSTGALTYLESFRNAWLDAGEDRSTVFLFVGFPISANAPAGTIGVAYEPGVCERMEPDPLLIIDWDQRCEFGYGIAQMVARSGSNYTATEFLKTKLMAHEIGHNFGGSHDSGAGCSTTAYAGDIMCPVLQVNGPNAFSSASAQMIRRHAQSTIGYAWRT